MTTPIQQSEIDFIRPRIVEGGWYYGDHPADEIANNAIDDLEVCLQRIDELERTLALIRGGTGEIPKNWGRPELLELNGRIYDYAHKALDRY